MLAGAPPGCQLIVSDGDFDQGRFRAGQAAGAAAAAAGRFEEASSHLSVALGEWRGPVLDDLREFDFVAAFAAKLVEDKVAAYSARAEAEIACGPADAVIGELEDNHIVRDDHDVSRHHAVIADTGTGFVITDLRSTNGVEVRGELIRASATLADGDRVCIGGRDFTFEVRVQGPYGDDPAVRY